MDTSTLTQIFGVAGSSYIRDSRSLHLFFQYLIYYWYQMSYLSDFRCCQQFQEMLSRFSKQFELEALKLVSWLDWSQCQVFNVGNFADPKIRETWSVTRSRIQTNSVSYSGLMLWFSRFAAPSEVLCALLLLVLSVWTSELIPKYW